MPRGRSALSIAAGRRDVGRAFHVEPLLLLLQTLPLPPLLIQYSTRMRSKYCTMKIRVSISLRIQYLCAVVINQFALQQSCDGDCYGSVPACSACNTVQWRSLQYCTRFDAFAFPVFFVELYFVVRALLLLLLLYCSTLDHSMLVLIVVLATL